MQSEGRPEGSEESGHRPRRALDNHYMEQIGQYNKDRLVSWVGVVVAVMLAAGSTVTMVLVTIRVQDQQIERLEDMDRQIRAEMMQRIGQLQGHMEDKVGVVAREVTLARKYQKDNREKIAECQTAVSRLSGLLIDQPTIRSRNPLGSVPDTSFVQDTYSGVWRNQLKTPLTQNILEQHGPNVR